MSSISLRPGGLTILPIRPRAFRPIDARNPRAQCPGVSPDLSTDRPYRGEGVAVLAGTITKG